MKHPILYGTVLIFIFCQSLSGQEAEIHGIITDSDNGNPVAYPYVLNFSRQQQVYGNSAGEFKLSAQSGDTLVMYGAGYFYRKFIVADTMLHVKPVPFTLHQQKYELSEARITGFGSYDDFRRDLITFDKPKTKTDKLNDYIADLSLNAAREAYAMAQAKGHLDGVTLMSVPILTPEEIERIKLNKIIEKEKVRDQIYHKFNPQVVKNITGLTDDDEIIEFMVFCKFEDAYLLEVSEYDLALRIALKYDLFRKNKEDIRNMENPLNFLDELLHSIA